MNLTRKYKIWILLPEENLFFKLVSKLLDGIYVSSIYKNPAYKMYLKNGENFLKITISQIVVYLKYEEYFKIIRCGEEIKYLKYDIDELLLYIINKKLCTNFSFICEF